MTRPSTRMQNANRFKLGLFATNCSGGLAMTKVPERWDASWDNALTANRLAEAAGLEFTLPIARWHGYRGETDTEGSSYETLTWAAGTLAATPFQAGLQGSWEAPLPPTCGPSRTALSAASRGFHAGLGAGPRST